MENIYNINNTLLPYINDEIIYKKLIDIFDEVKQKKKTEQYLLNYCKKTFKYYFDKKKLCKFIIEKHHFDYEVMFLQLMDLLPYSLIIDSIKNKIILLIYIVYRIDYETFDKILSENCDIGIAYCFFNGFLFFKVLITRNNDFINRMFDLIFLFLDERLIDNEDYDLMKSNIIILKKHLWDRFGCESLDNYIDTLTLKLKVSYARYEINKVYNK